MNRKNFAPCRIKGRKRRLINHLLLSLQTILFLFSIMSLQEIVSPCEIKLIIYGDGDGNSQLINSEFTDPSKVFVNGDETECIKTCNLGAGESTVILQYDYSLTNWFGMFGNLTSIKEVDLSNCDASQVTSMVQMFQGCSGLKSINLSTLDTSNVEDFSFMFSGCSSLTSADVSGFDVSKDKIWNQCLKIVQV